MPDDAAPEPHEQHFVRWLRALADAVERDPALAARVQQEAAATPVSDEPALPPDLATLTVPDEPAVPIAPAAPSETLVETVELRTPASEPAEAAITPTLRHTRRSSRYGPPSVTGRAADLGTGIPDPFALYATGGEDGLRRALDTLRIGSLRAIIRAHGIDPQGKLGAGATEKRLMSAIIAAAKRASAPPPRTPRTPRKGTPRTQKAEHK